MGLDWSNLQKDLFLSCSWDGSLKLVRPVSSSLASSSEAKPSPKQWNPTRQTSLLTIPARPSRVACPLSLPLSVVSPSNRN